VAAALFGVVLHLGMVAAIYRMRFDLAVFAVMMWGLYLLFLGPEILPRKMPGHRMKSGGATVITSWRAPKG
jgi:hypothetical protein